MTKMRREDERREKRYEMREDEEREEIGGERDMRGGRGEKRRKMR